MDDRGRGKAGRLAAEMARGIRALMKFGARLNVAKEGGPIVRVDIVVGGSGFGHQAPLALAPSLALRGLGRVERESMTNFI